MTTAPPWIFDYAGLPFEGATEPPHVWVEIGGPLGVAAYPCLLDSGSSFSVFPHEVARELGVDDQLLEPATVRTVNGRREVLHLPSADQVAVRLDDDCSIPIAPYFIPPEVVAQEEFESDYYILGRDFFLPLALTFRQAAEVVEISPIA